MSGVFGLIDMTGAVDVAAAEKRIKGFRLPGSARHRIELLRRGRTLIGRYSLDIFKQLEINALEPSGSILVTSGYRVGDFPNPARPGDLCSGFGRETLQFIDQKVEDETAGVFAQFDGAWQILHCNRDGSALTVIVDRYGLQPLYYFENPACRAFAPEFSLLFVLLGDTPGLDRESLAELFEIGLVTGNRTLFAGVSVFPPGSVARFARDAVSFHRYWRPVFSDGSQPFDSREMATALDAVLRKSIRQRLALAPQVAVSLSGGLDSRLLLAVTTEEELPVSAYTFGPEDSGEHAIATAVAKRLEVEHRCFIDSPLQMSEVLEIGVRKSGGLGNVLDFGGLPHLPRIARQAQIVINGYGGNELWGFLAFDLLRFVFRRSHKYLIRWLAAKLNPGWHNSQIEMIRHSLAEGAPRPVERIGQLGEDYPIRSPIPLIYHFFFEEKARRANLLGVTADCLRVEPVVPFYSNEIVDLALTIPPRERLLARFYRRFLRSHYPVISGLVYSRSGLAVSASTWSIALEKLRRYRSPKHAPDAPWDAWLRGELREYLGDHLLVGQPRIYDVIDGELVKCVVTNFLQRKNFPARVVGQLLSCELFLRVFWSGENDQPAKQAAQLHFGF